MPFRIADLVANVSIASNGNITAYSSDERLKENLEPIESAVEKVEALRGVTFNWNDEAIKRGLPVTKEQKEVGVLAQDVQRVLPEAVAPAPFDVNDDGESKSGQDYLTVRYEKIVPLLIEAIKEQQIEIENLKKLIQDK
jgi:hypothetical protein